jgi:hypothetical protein
MTPARMRALQELVNVRRSISTLINELSGDPSYRDFVKRLESGEEVSTRAIRPGDVPPMTDQEVADKYGIDIEPPADGTIPPWVLERIGKHIADTL